MPLRTSLARFAQCVDKILPEDKRRHYVMGQQIALVWVLLFPGLWWCCAPVAFAAGALKELTDWLLNRRAARRGEPVLHAVEGLDGFFTTFGGITVYLAALAILHTH